MMNNQHSKCPDILLRCPDTRLKFPVTLLKCPDTPLKCPDIHPKFPDIHLKCPGTLPKHPDIRLKRLDTMLGTSSGPQVFGSRETMCSTAIIGSKCRQIPRNETSLVENDNCDQMQ